MTPIIQMNEELKHAQEMITTLEKAIKLGIQTKNTHKLLANYKGEVSGIRTCMNILMEGN